MYIAMHTLGEVSTAPLGHVLRTIDIHNERGSVNVEVVVNPTAKCLFLGRPDLLPVPGDELAWISHQHVIEPEASVAVVHVEAWAFLTKDKLPFF